MSTCTYELIHQNLTNACEYVKENCESSYIDFFAMHYCLFENKYFLTLPVLGIILLLCFYLLSDTSNRYLSPALTILSDKLKMSQNLAGVTLLALGNGAPDVISGIVGTSGSEGIEFAVGSLIASGVFITCIVFSSVVLYSHSVQLTKQLFIRDMLLYLLAVVILLVFSIYGKVNIYQAIGFFSLYIINVIVAFCQDLNAKKNAPRTEKKKIRVETNESEEHDDKKEAIIPSDVKDAELAKNHKLDGISSYSDDSSEDYAMESEAIARVITFKIVNFFKNPTEDAREIKDVRDEPDLNNKNELDDNSINNIKNQDFELNTISKSIQDVMKDDHFYQEENSTAYKQDKMKKIFKKKSILEVSLITGLNSIKYRLKKNYFKNSQSKWEDKGFLEKIFYILIEFPLVFLRDLTIPSVELDRWNRTFFIFMPLTSVLFFLLITRYMYLIIKYWEIAIAPFVILLIFSFLISKYTYCNRVPGSIKLLCVYSFFMSILWIWAVAKTLIDVLQIFGVILDVPTTFLGMTLLSLGNSLPDLTLNCALAKSGYGEMGIAGSIAGPLFNLLIGLGASMIKMTITQGDIPFQLFAHKHITIIIAGGVLFLNLLRLLIQSCILKFNMTKSVAIIGYILYILFFVGICLFTFVFIENPFMNS